MMAGHPRFASRAIAGGLVLAACGGGSEEGRESAGGPGPRIPDTTSGVVSDTQLLVDSLGQEFLIITTGRPRIREVRPRAGAADPDAPGAFETVDPPTARQRMEASPVPWYILDVREAEEYVAGHIEGAALVPIGVLEANIEDLHLRTDQVLLVYADGEGREAEAARILAGYGFPTVRILDGGLPAWREAGLPVEDPR